MDIGDRIFLPKSVDVKSPLATAENQSLSDDELKFVQGLELYKVLPRICSWFIILLGFFTVLTKPNVQLYNIRIQL